MLHRFESLIRGMEECEHCQDLLPDDIVTESGAEVHQVLDIPEVPRTVVNHVLHRRMCPHCQRLTKAQLPPGVPRSPCGPGVMARGTYFTGRLRVSRRETEEAMEDRHGIAISVGGIKNLESRMADALNPAVSEVEAAIQKEKVLNRLPAAIGIPSATARSATPT